MSPTPGSRNIINEYALQAYLIFSWGTKAHFFLLLFGKDNGQSKAFSSFHAADLRIPQHFQ